MGLISKIFRTPKSHDLITDQITSGEYALLNNDDTKMTAELFKWMQRSVFDCNEIEEFAADLMRQDPPSTIHAYNERLVVFTSKAPLKGKAGAVDQRDLRFRQAALAHLLRLAVNQSAYQVERINESAGGFWPDPTNDLNGRSLFTEFPFGETNPFIDRRTPVSSAGSCFAVEIAHQLQADGFNYVIAEGNRAGNSSVNVDAPVDSSAAWGIIFNTPSFRQLVERAFGYRSLPKILWSAPMRGESKETFMDPFREGIEFATPEEYLLDYAQHIAATRKALIEAKVFIITLGLNEVWTFRMDGSVFSRSPWRIAPSLVEQKVLTVQENVDELQLLLDIIRQHNPELKLIVTLSPIPLHATFLSKSMHVVEANTHSKAVLRVAAKQFCDANKDVFYFPSYELVMSGLEDPWEADQRHVKRSSVERVMSMFKRMYVVDT